MFYIFQSNFESFKSNIIIFGGQIYNSFTYHFNELRRFAFHSALKLCVFAVFVTLYVLY